MAIDALLPLWLEMEGAPLPRGRETFGQLLLRLLAHLAPEAVAAGGLLVLHGHHHPLVHQYLLGNKYLR